MSNPIEHLELAMYMCEEKRRRGGNKDTLLRSASEPLPLAGVSFCLWSRVEGVCDSGFGATPKEEGRPSRWKDGLTRSFVHRSTHLLLTRERVEASG